LGESRWQLRGNFGEARATLPPVHGTTVHIHANDTEADIRDLSEFRPGSLIVVCG
jgi:hypothetical protein